MNSSFARGHNTGRAENRVLLPVQKRKIGVNGLHGPTSIGHTLNTVVSIAFCRRPTSYIHLHPTAGIGVALLGPSIYHEQGS